MQGIALCEGINQRARGRPGRPPRGRGQGKALGPGEKRIYRCYSVKEALTANNIHDRYIEVVHILAFHSRHTRPLLLSLTSTVPRLDVASGQSMNFVDNPNENLVFQLARFSPFRVFHPLIFRVISLIRRDENGDSKGCEEVFSFVSYVGRFVFDDHSG